jgi:hypothetical protein
MASTSGSMPLFMRVGTDASYDDATPLFIKGAQLVSANSSMPLFIAASALQQSMPLFISATTAGPVTSTSPLFIGGPATGTINSTPTLFVRGEIANVNANMPLVVWSDYLESGVMPLVVVGGSNMYPKEWYYSRRGGVNSSGYIPIGGGITAYINGQ